MRAPCPLVRRAEAINTGFALSLNNLPLQMLGLVFDIRSLSASHCEASFVALYRD